MGNPLAIQFLSGATPTWDVSLYKFAKIEAAANTAITLSGEGTPDGGVLHFVQGGAGGYTLSINGVAISVNATGLTRVDWAYDGERYSFGTNVSGGAQSSITPAAPTAGTVNDTDGIDTFTFTLSTGYAASDHEYQISGGSWTACTSNVISVGNIAVAIGALLVRVKAATGRNASPALANEQAFTVANITPAAPTGGTVDDSLNTFTFTLNPSYTASEHEYSINGGAYADCASNVISVGDIAVAIGALLVRVKAATGRNASATLANATAFTVAATTIPTTDLAAYWTFEEASGDFVDSHNGLNLVRSGGASTVAGKVNNAVELLHASNQYLTGPTANTVSAGATGLTVAGWFYINATTGVLQQILGKWGTAGNREWVMDYDNGAFSITVSANGTDGYVGISSAPLSTQIWYFVAARWDGTNLGISINTGAWQNVACTTAFNAGAAALTIGRTEGGGATYQSDIRVDELGIWQRALTDSEITDLYNAGTGKTY